eukprot:683844-Prymnesium_polylepis.1
MVAASLHHRQRPAPPMLWVRVRRRSAAPRHHSPSPPLEHPPPPLEPLPWRWLWCAAQRLRVVRTFPGGHP